MLSSDRTGFRYLPEEATFDKTGSSIFIKDNYSLEKILALLNSKVSCLFLNIYSPTIAYQIGEVRRIPILNFESISENIVQDNIAISKADWDSHETSWDFQRNPLWEQQLDIILDEMRERGVFSEDATIDDIGPFNLPDLLQPLEILVENYESEWEDLFHQLHRNEEELNRQFIEIYGLQDELTPDVPLEEITILQKG